MSPQRLTSGWTPTARGGGRGSGPLHAYMCLLLQHNLYDSAATAQTQGILTLALHQAWGQEVHGPRSSLPPYSVSEEEVDEEQALANLSEGSSLDVPSYQAVLRFGTEILADPAFLHIAPVPPTDPVRDLVRIKRDKPAEDYLRLASHRSGARPILHGKKERITPKNVGQNQTAAA